MPVSQKAQVNYLGFIVKDGTVMPSDKKTIAIKHFPIPTDRRAVQSFLGLTGYFRKFIPRYAPIALLLTDLLKEEATFIFADKEKHAFNQLKETLRDLFYGFIVPTRKSSYIRCI